MISIDDATIEQKIQSINATKVGFRHAKDKRNAFERVLRAYYERLRTAQTPSQADIAQSLHALYGALNTPELVDQQLLINFISVIIRFVENAGVGYAFSKAFMDRQSPRQTGRRQSAPTVMESIRSRRTPIRILRCRRRMWHNSRAPAVTKESGCRRNSEWRDGGQRPIWRAITDWPHAWVRKLSRIAPAVTGLTASFLPAIRVRRSMLRTWRAPAGSAIPG